LTVKEIHSDEIDGTEETEIAVEDFATTHLLLTKLGFVAKSYQENKRTSYVLDGAQLEVDEWPLIPPYLEIEGSSRDAVLAIAERLDIPAERLTGENTIKVYARYGIDLTARKDLRF
jgi:adenylate cyclase class 2